MCGPRLVLSPGHITQYRIVRRESSLCKACHTMNIGNFEASLDFLNAESFRKWPVFAEYWEVDQNVAAKVNKASAHGTLTLKQSLGQVYALSDSGQRSRPIAIA